MAETALVADGGPQSPAAGLVVSPEHVATTRRVAAPASIGDDAPVASGSFWSGRRCSGRALRVGALFAAMGALVAVRAPLCMFALVTRHPCPACGLTRATLALAKGDVHAATTLHPLALVLVPLVLAAVAYNAYHYVRSGRMMAAEAMRGRWLTRSAALLVAGVLFVWIARFFGAFGGPVPV